MLAGSGSGSGLRQKERNRTISAKSRNVLVLNFLRICHVEFQRRHDIVDEDGLENRDVAGGDWLRYRKESLLSACMDSKFSHFQPVPGWFQL